MNRRLRIMLVDQATRYHEANLLVQSSTSIVSPKGQQCSLRLPESWSDHSVEFAWGGRKLVQVRDNSSVKALYARLTSRISLYYI